MISLGIDIGGTSVKLAAIQDGTTLWTAQSPSYAQPSTSQLIDAIRHAKEGQKPFPRADAVGLCVPGLLDRPRRIITLAVNVPGLMNIVLDDLVEQAVGYRPRNVEISNDAVATGYDIWSSHPHQGRILVLAIGTGVGAAVLDDGRPLFVEGGSPGHVGQIDVSISGDDVIGPDGGRGSLEGYLGTAALAKRYGQGKVNSAVENMQIAEPPMKALVRAIRICHAMYRPMHVYLTGGIGIRLQRLVPQLRDAVCDKLTSVARENWTLDTGRSDYHAALGVAKMAGNSA